MTQTNMLTRKFKAGIIALLTMLISASAHAQPLQIVRGIITDQQSKIPIPSVSITITCNGYISGTVTDIDGNYIISDIPLGRAIVRISHASYQEQVIPDVIIESGKETVLNVEMLEQVKTMKEVVVKATREKITDKQNDIRK